MARTPLFRLIERSMRMARYSLVTSEPVDELLDRRAETGISRRQFVVGAAVAGAAVALQGCAPSAAGTVVAPRRSGDGPVLIIGAGIAGLTAAYRLRQRGVPVRIIEAQNRVGGRMFSLRNYFPDGQVCELGGELIDTPHTHIQKLARELGITLDDLSTDDATLDKDIWFFGGARRTDAEVVAAFRPIAERIVADVAALGADPDPTYRAPGAAAALDRMTIAEWFDRAGISGWVRELLTVGYTTEYGLEIDRQSALNFLLMIDTTPSEFRIFGESDERYHVQGGNDLITRALAAKVSDAIETNTVLEALSARGDGSFTASLMRGGSSTTATASHVLLAVPFTTLRDVRLDVPLPDPKRRAIAELGYGTNAKLMVGFSERVWRTRHRSNGSVLTSLPFQLTWETSRLQPGRSGILTNFTGGKHGVDLGNGRAEDQATQLVTDLDRIIPGAVAAHAGMKAMRFHWPSFPWTKGSYASYHPGQWTGFRGAEGESVGRLHFAGEHCSLDAQGFMEGGCETGEAAATAIANSLGARVGLGRREEPRRLMA